MVVDDTVCRTIHVFNTKTMNTLSVEKECMKPSLCSSKNVGCETSDDGNTEVSTYYNI